MGSCLRRTVTRDDSLGEISGHAVLRNRSLLISQQKPLFRIGRGDRAMRAVRRRLVHQSSDAVLVDKAHAMANLVGEHLFGHPSALVGLDLQHEGGGDEDLRAIQSPIGSGRGAEEFGAAAHRMADRDGVTGMNADRLRMTTGAGSNDHDKCDGHGMAPPVERDEGRFFFLHGKGGIEGDGVVGAEPGTT